MMNLFELYARKSRVRVRVRVRWLNCLNRKTLLCLLLR